MADVIRFVLRLSPTLHDKLKAIAARESRSLHGQLLYILGRFVEDDERRGGD